MRKRLVDANPPVKLLLTIDEAAQALSLGRSLLYDLVLRGKIASIKINRYRRVSVEALEAFVAEQQEREVA